MARHGGAQTHAAGEGGLSKFGSPCPDYQNFRMIDIGDFAPDFVLPDEKGRGIFSRAPHFAGRFILMLLLPRADDPAQQAMLRDCATRAADADAAGVSILAVTGKPPAENDMLRLACKTPFKLLSDSQGKVLAGYGAGEQPRALLVDANARIVAFPLPQALVDTAVAEATNPRRTTEPLVIAAQAPVLAIANSR